MVSTHCPMILNLHDRGMFEGIFPYNSSHEVASLLNEGPQHVYAGFDPTACSLHIGNLLVLVNLLHWQRAGHHVIALLGCATARIGDPSGHLKDREEQVPEIVGQRASHIRENIENVFTNHEKYIWNKTPNASLLHPIQFVNNEDWYKDINVIDFLSGIGRYFRMGAMLLKDSVSKRLNSNQGMNFPEFSYQIFQANDWLHLFKTYKCTFQVGGEDQMGNIVSGHILIRRVLQKPAYGLTLPLITTETGDKFGKSASNAIWLNKTLTTSFNFYQFFLRTEDSKVEQLLKLFTFLSLEEIAKIMEAQRSNPEQRIAQTKLAEEVTLLVHGEKELKTAKAASSILYGKNVELLGQLSFEELSNVLENGTAVDLQWKPGRSVLQFAIETPCFSGSKGKASKMIKAGGFYINLQKAENPDQELTQSAHILPNNVTVVRIGSYPKVAVVSDFS